MVSRKTTLKQYYQIDVTTIHQNYFLFQNQYFYITDRKIEPIINKIYSQYIQQFNIEPFQRIKNNYGSEISNGYQVYLCPSSTLHLNDYLQKALKLSFQEGIKVKELKNSWIKKVDLVKTKISKHAQRVDYNEHYVVCLYYYIGLFETAIQLLNLVENEILPKAIQHIDITIEQSFINPYNLIMHSRVYDVVHCYKKGLIDITTIKNFMDKGVYSNIELIVIYAYQFYHEKLFNFVLAQEENKNPIQNEMVSYYQHIPIYKKQLLDLEKLLKNKVKLPIINWLDKL